MKRIALFVSVLMALLLGGCSAASLFDASTADTLEACFTCAKGVQDADQLDSLSKRFEGFKIPEE